MNEKILREYAKLGVTMGANVQKGQTLLINTSVEGKELARYAVEEAYKAGAKEVVVNFSDDLISRLHYEYQDIETLCEIPEWMVEQKVGPYRKGAAVLHLLSEVPGVLAGISSDKISKAMLARQTKFKEANEITMANKIQWSILGVPNPMWAKKVFPELEESEAMKKLWEKVLYAVQVKGDDSSIAYWDKHNHELKEREKALNNYNFKSLHFQNGAGTDLTIELVKNHIWAGGCETTQGGIVFNPNMPTEEIFCMPYKFGVNGSVVSTKPLNYNGTLIEQFTLTFKEGKVVDYSATSELDALKSLIEFDEGSSYIGEVALVPYSSPISQSNILFFNTLYDENASCHLALGRAYPMNVKGGTEMSKEELAQAGSNDSMTHVDFMFGSSDMKITGIAQDNQEVKVFENGDFVF